MAHSITFDTLAYYKKLRASGMSEKQAEVLVETWAEVLGKVLEDKSNSKKNYLKPMKNKLLMYVSFMLVAEIIILTLIIKF